MKQSVQDENERESFLLRRAPTHDWEIWMKLRLPNDNEKLYEKLLLHCGFRPHVTSYFSMFL